MALNNYIERLQNNSRNANIALKQSRKDAMSLDTSTRRYFKTVDNMMAQRKRFLNRSLIVAITAITVAIGALVYVNFFW